LIASEELPVFGRLRLNAAPFIDGCFGHLEFLCPRAEMGGLSVLQYLLFLGRRIVFAPGRTEVLLLAAFPYLA